MQSPSPPRAVVANILDHVHDGVFVVDDDDLVRRVAKRMLVKAGYSVLEAENGKVALAVYQANRDKIALVLLDLSMPVMGGEETFGALRALAAGLPIVLSSGSPSGLGCSRDSRWRAAARVRGIARSEIDLDRALQRRVERDDAQGRSRVVRRGEGQLHGEVLGGLGDQGQLVEDAHILEAIDPGLNIGGVPELEARANVGGQEEVRGESNIIALGAGVGLRPVAEALVLEHHRRSDGGLEAGERLQMQARPGADEDAEGEPSKGVAVVLNEGLGLDRTGERDPIAEVLEILAHEGIAGFFGKISAREEEDQMTPTPHLAERAGRERDQAGVAAAHVGRALADDRHAVCRSLLGGDQRLDIDDLGRGGRRDEGRRGDEEGCEEAA